MKFIFLAAPSMPNGKACKRNNPDERCALSLNWSIPSNIANINDLTHYELTTDRPYILTKDSNCTDNIDCNLDTISIVAVNRCEYPSSTKMFTSLHSLNSTPDCGCSADCHTKGKLLP